MQNNLNTYRQELKDDTEEYLIFETEEYERFGTGYYTTLDAKTELPSRDPQEIYEKVYTHGKRTDLLNNAEFNILRDPLYDILLTNAREIASSVFVHGSGIGHEVMILAREGLEVFYYEPDENKKDFQKWRQRKHLNESDRLPTDVTYWHKPWDIGVDLVVSFDVLEHLHAPFRTIHHLGELIHDEGHLLLMPAFQYPQHKQHLPQNEWISGYIFKKVMEGLGFKLIWQQGNFFKFQPVFNTTETVWRL